MKPVPAACHGRLRPVPPPASVTRPKRASARRWYDAADGLIADGRSDLGRGRRAVEPEPLEDLEPHRVGERAQCAGIADDDIAGSH